MLNVRLPILDQNKSYVLCGFHIKGSIVSLVLACEAFK